MYEMNGAPCLCGKNNLIDNLCGRNIHTHTNSINVLGYLADGGNGENVTFELWYRLT